MGPNTVETSTTAPLASLLITVKAIELEKSLIVMCKISGLFVNTLTFSDTYSLLNRDKLTKSLEMQLSEKQKNFF